MTKNIRMLQLGTKSWSKQIALSGGIQLEFLNLNTFTSNLMPFFLKENKAYDVVLCTDSINNEALNSLSEVIESYSIIIDESLKPDVEIGFQKKKSPIYKSMEDIPEVINDIKYYFFSGQFGTKLAVDNIYIQNRSHTKVHIKGQEFLNIKGLFSKKKTVLSWKSTIGIPDNRIRKLWLEYSKKGNVSLSLKVVGFSQFIADITWIKNYSEDEFCKGVEIENDSKTKYVSVSLLISGEGEVDVGALHYRDSRSKYGEFILGGEKIFDEKNQEIFYYLNPGNLMPPLNVYFSGYRSAEGFEGFYMMKDLGCPFLLICDPRLEGGSFYFGGTFLEEGVTQIIQQSLDHLGFSNSDLILSGLSMGSFGALYYASQLQPKYVIVGKPLINLGDMAKNEQLIRPGGFPTSLDILMSATGGTTEESVEQLNSKFWASLDVSRVKNTKFIIAYMREDDYDRKAYQALKEFLEPEAVVIIGKGITGRHNDNTTAIISWFIAQFRKAISSYKTILQGDMNVKI